jgi:tight adherence protein B
LNPDLITLVLLAVFFISLIGLVIVIIRLSRVGSSTRIQGRINRYIEPANTMEPQVKAFKDRSITITNDSGKIRSWLNDTLAFLSSEKLQIKISSAYWAISDTEFILIRILVVVLGLIIGWVIVSNILGGLFLAAVMVLLPPIILDRSITNRQQKFHAQLLDVLILVRGAIQAGYSLLQSLDLAVKELVPPASEEFGRVLREVKFGFPMEQALLNLSERMESDDLQIVVTAIIINMQVGGNLSTILDSIIDTIRDRMHLQGEVKSLTSYARYVGNFLSIMPFVTALIIFVVTPGYFDNVADKPITQIIGIFALTSVIIGNIWIRKVAKVRV